MKKKPNTLFSREAIWREIRKEKQYPKLGEFLRLQNEIQVYLTSLVIIKATTRGCVDQKWIESICKTTIGKLISYYKPCADQTKEEGDLIINLGKYNSLRNKIVHQLIYLDPKEEKLEFHERDWGEINKMVNNSIVLGKRVLEQLLDVISNSAKAS